MQGDTLKSLRIIANAKGWDPTKIEGKPIEVGLDLRKPDEKGDVSLSKFPGAGGGPQPDQSTYDNPVQGPSIDWSTPANPAGGVSIPGMDEQQRRDWSVPERSSPGRSSGADPYAGKTGAR